MQRREFITLLGGAAVAWPLAVRAQQSVGIRRIGVVLPYDNSDPDGQARINAFQMALQSLGWREGDNVHIEVRWPGGDAGRMRAYAAELVALAPDLIVVNSNLGVAALRQANATLPIVFVGVSDPVDSGFVKSLGQPGGNITGFANFEAAIGGKWLQILKESDPAIRRVIAILHPDIAANAAIAQATQAAASSLGVTVTLARVRDAKEIEGAITAFGTEAGGGLIALPNPVNIVQHDLIVRLAARQRLSAIYPYRLFAAGGGLMSYGIDQVDMFRRSASYVDRILRGAKPGELPVQLPVKYELVINLKTAKTLGLDVPPALLTRADEVIE